MKPWKSSRPAPERGSAASETKGPRPPAGSFRRVPRAPGPVSFDTLGHGDPYFIHQLLVDAYAAQHATAASKPITTAFALVGLYLFAERGFTGGEVQRAHRALAARPRSWPRFDPPQSRGTLTVAEVLAAPAGEGRDAMRSNGRSRSGLPGARTMLRAAVSSAALL